MAHQTLLSDLCSVCNNATSKYRCPGCGTRTCSLPCYKRHQTRAQCTGKRDPTKFVKKSSLATPAGIDHDFNYLTSIEREVEKAGRQIEDRGLGPPPPRTGPRKGEISDAQFEAIGVHVIRAPKGLSRQRENKTRRSGRNNTIWTVEWIQPDSGRLLNEVIGHQPIAEAFLHAIGQNPPRPAKKRKRGDNEGPEQAPEGQDASTSQNDVQPNQAFDVAEEQREPAAPGQEGAISSAHPGPHELSGPEPVPPYHYYLLRPRTNTSRHVLIPVPPTSALDQVLCGKTVLEFPTIYVFPGGDLPDGFVLEKQYLESTSPEAKQMTNLLGSVPHPEVDDKASSQHLDSTRILEVLQQDLGGAL
ncbi:hypothetical protein EJ04DRAFT_195988 [Polyplosphaeria fusca]|uniref:HIT-type domain-containing protein n=1 Tax=Polyplosphaeria fusca TaxID=682080 RepID=A0A9P4V3U4_9PLEO|nr:hypothetical protein EJ04DRAFT_195988 [Polyplosphaeria fusca]